MPKASKPYHHGDLPRALLEAAERLLESDGVQALTLRAIAREVGVTHAAPANHFEDLTGLLSELAASGHRRMASELRAATAADVASRTKATGTAYVAFAKAHPGLFALMFRSEKLDPQRASLRDAIAASRGALRTMVAERPTSAKLSPIELAAQGTALWALAHGYAILMIEGRLTGTLRTLGAGVTPETFFQSVLDAVMLRNKEI